MSSATQQASWRGTDGARAREPVPHVAGLVVGEPFGVQLVIDWSLGPIVALLVTQLGLATLPELHPEWTGVTLWATAFCAGVLLLAAIAVHELVPALVARRVGVPLRRITLYLFGGAAHLSGEPPSARAELAMALVGPIVSLALGGLLVLAGVVASGSLEGALATSPASVFGGASPVATLLLFAGAWSGMLGLMHLVPALPLDGGHAFRALLWRFTGDLERATAWAAWTGRATGVALMVLGLVVVLGASRVEGIWLGAIGWFLGVAARAGYQEVVVRSALEGVPVSLVMRGDVAVTWPGRTVRSFVDEQLRGAHQTAFPVVVGDRVVGIVSGRDVRELPRREWDRARVEQVMTPQQDLVLVDLHAPASEALEALVMHEIEQVVVVDRGALAGVVRRKDLMRWLALTEPQRP